MVLDPRWLRGCIVSLIGIPGCQAAPCEPLEPQQTCEIAVDAAHVARVDAADLDGDGSVHLLVLECADHLERDCALTTRSADGTRAGPPVPGRYADIAVAPDPAGDVVFGLRQDEASATLVRFQWSGNELVVADMTSAAAGATAIAVGHLVDGDSVDIVELAGAGLRVTRGVGGDFDGMVTEWNVRDDVSTIEAVDVDGDGIHELLVDGSRTAVRFGASPDQELVALPGEARHLAPGDFDDDGALDLGQGHRAVLDLTGPTPTTQEIASDGLGRSLSPQQEPEVVQALAGPFDAAPGDELLLRWFAPEVIDGARACGGVARVPGESFAERPKATDLLRHPGGFSALTTADLDGDGDVELIAAPLGGEQLLVVGMDSCP